MDKLIGDAQRGLVVETVRHCRCRLLRWFVYIVEMSEDGALREMIAGSQSNQEEEKFRKMRVDGRISCHTVAWR